MRVRVVNREWRLLPITISVPVVAIIIIIIFVLVVLRRHGSSGEQQAGRYCPADYH
jgi:hypothetical protein